MKLNLACGLDVRDGWVNVDSHPAPGISQAIDLYKFPWQLASGSFDEVLAKHFMEHVPRGETFALVMEEVHRILVPGGLFTVIVPHFKNVRAVWSHPDHKGPILPSTWDIFSSRSPQSYFSRARFHLESWHTSARSARHPDRLPINGTGLSVHIEQRAPFMRKLVTEPLEATYHLRRV